MHCMHSVAVPCLRACVTASHMYQIPQMREARNAPVVILLNPSHVTVLHVGLD